MITMITNQKTQKKQPKSPTTFRWGSYWRREEPTCKILLVTLRSSVRAKMQTIPKSSTLARNIGGEVTAKVSPFSLASAKEDKLLGCFQMKCYAWLWSTYKHR